MSLTPDDKDGKSESAISIELFVHHTRVTYIVKVVV